MPSSEHVSPRARRAIAAAALVLVARLVFHAFFVPPFEGPDEPFHLSRAEAVAREGAGGLARTVPLSVDVQRAIGRNPCSRDLARAFGCATFPGAASAASRAPFSVRADYPNYENNQPPLYYAAAGAFLFASRSIAPPSAGREAEDDLRRLRLLSVAFVAMALFGPIKSIARRRSAPFAA
ncbi:MAG TPA: hypothetical protein VFL12_12450, partial [Thermoanaerobaculia bacterium]|nr:hypothetical protein [Thermoanaerobaculia bacterium]